MPPKQSTKKATGTGRGRSTKKTSKAVEPSPSPRDPFESSDDQDARPPATTTTSREVTMVDDAEEEAEPDKTIPADLLTRLLHEFFAKDATRMSRDANAAAGKYFDVFVREAIARAAQEKEGGFLEVEDLEKVSPQLLLDL